MDINEFRKHIPVLQQGPFELLPDPKGIDHSDNRFNYVDHDITHVKIENVNTKAEYSLSLSLIELINPGRPGVMVLRRQLAVRNGSFV